MLPVLKLQNRDGSQSEIGPEHPDYFNLLRQHRDAHPRDPVKEKTKCAFIALLSLALCWMNWWLAATEGYFYEFLCLFAPFALLTLLVVFLPWKFTLAFEKAIRGEHPRGRLAQWLAVAFYLGLACAVTAADVGFLYAYARPTR